LDTTKLDIFVQVENLIHIGLPFAKENFCTVDPPTTLKKSTRCFMFRKNDSPSQNEDIAGDGESR
jgi:hypothetical protein